MIINVNEKWRINVDEARNYSPEKKMLNSKTGEEYWKGYGYYGSAEGALSKIVSEDTIEKSGDTTTIFEYTLALREVSKGYTDILKEALRYV